SREGDRQLGTVDWLPSRLRGLRRASHHLRVRCHAIGEVDGGRTGSFGMPVLASTECGGINPRFLSIARKGTAMTWVAKTLHIFPELAMFLAVGIGYWLGNIKFGKFALGTVTTALLAGLVIGQAGIEINRELRWGLFYLFLFANGYSAGPQFFRAL